MSTLFEKIKNWFTPNNHLECFVYSQDDKFINVIYVNDVDTNLWKVIEILNRQQIDLKSEIQNLKSKLENNAIKTVGNYLVDYNMQSVKHLGEQYFKVTFDKTSDFEKYVDLLKEKGHNLLTQTDLQATLNNIKATRPNRK